MPADSRSFIKEHVTMVVDAVRSYFDAASGLTELTRKRAVAAAKTLLRAVDERAAGATGPPDRADPPAGEDDGGTQRTSRVGHDIQSLASELIETNQANRAALSSMVQAEVTRVLDRLDLVRRDEYERVVRRVAELERRLATQRVPVSRTVQTAGTPADAASPADAPAPPGDTSTADRDGTRTEPEEAPASASAEATPAEPEEASTGVDGASGTVVPADEEADTTATVDDQEEALVAESGEEWATTAATESASEGEAEESGGEAGDTTERRNPDTAQRSGGGSNKGTKASGKQTGSNTAGKSGRSKSTTKRSGGRARNTAQAKKNEQ
ncbi:accessory factor UbiK family protein [Halostreptopolyspora alba]|uniref:accessory factor UbiK family protein n=1 Tax=Halostreptopolyspora alba TaxID=2487137 RepID=UPI00371E1BB2